MSSASTRFSSSESARHLHAATRIRGVERKKTRTRVRAVIKRCLITVAGFLGVIAILVTIAPFFGWTVIRLATDSMAPTFPTDSLLLTHQVPVASLSVGEIVTVQRPGQLPITHRLVAITTESGGFARLTLKGDANATTDPAPYLVRTVGLVTGGVQWGGQVFAALRSTAGLATLTVLAALTVLWAWWPSTPHRKAHAAKRGATLRV